MDGGAREEQRQDNPEKYVMAAWAIAYMEQSWQSYHDLQPRRPTQAISSQGWPNRFLGLSQCLNLDLYIFKLN